MGGEERSGRIANRRTTIADVAAAAGISGAAASMALNGKGRVGPRTRARVKRIAEELNYRPSARARRLRGGRSETVALVTSVTDVVVGRDSHLSFLLDLAFPLGRILLEHGYSTLLLPPLADSRHLDMVDADGVIIVDPLRGDPLCADLQSRGMQVVTIGNVPGIQVNGVVERGDAGAGVSLRHLTEQGARHIAVLVTSEEYSVASNVRSFVENCSLPPGVRFTLADTPASGGEESARLLTLNLLAKDPTIDAIYAPVDTLALGALRGSREMGRRVPEDLFISTNFDGPRASAASPPMTALNLDLPGLAGLTAHLLMQCLADPTDDVRVISVPAPYLHKRESTAARAS